MTSGLFLALELVGSVSNANSLVEGWDFQQHDFLSDGSNSGHVLHRLRTVSKVRFPVGRVEYVRRMAVMW